LWLVSEKCRCAGARAIPIWSNRANRGMIRAHIRDA
jgi:hypothetical protein